MSQYDPSNEGLLNYARGCRWVYNWNTFLNNSSTLHAAPLSLTFAKNDIQHLLEPRPDPDNPGQQIAAGGIRFYMGVSSFSNQSYLQLFAVRCEGWDEFSGNHEINYNDVLPNTSLPMGSYVPKVFGYDVQLSSATPGQASHLNPPAYFPPNLPTASSPVLINGSYTYPADPGTYEIQQPAAHNLCEAYFNLFLDANNPFPTMSGNPKTAHVTIGSTTEQRDFEAHPLMWPRAFMFSKEDMLALLQAPSVAHINYDVRVYFGITDSFDEEFTGARPGNLKLFMVGSDHHGNDILPPGLEDYANILDFALPCPDCCGGGGTRLYSPS